MTTREYEELADALIRAVLQYGVDVGRDFALEKDEFRRSSLSSAQEVLDIVAKGIGLAVVGKRLGFVGTVGGGYRYERKPDSTGKHYRWSVRELEQPTAPTVPARDPQLSVADGALLEALRNGEEMVARLRSLCESRGLLNGRSI